MMRAYFCRYMDVLFFCLFDDLHASISRAVAQMQVCSCLSCQHHITHGDDVLDCIADAAKSLFADRFIVICHTAVHQVDVLTVCHDRNAALCCDLHCFFAEQGIHNGFTVLTDCRSSFRYHGFDVGKFFSLLSFCDRTGLQYVDRCHRFCLVVYITDIKSVICYRLCIRHRQHGGKSSVCRCSCSCLNRLLVRLSRIPQVNMQVDQARHNVAAFCIDHFFCLFLDLLVYLYNLILLDQDIVPAIFSGVRINHSAVFYQYTHLLDSFL